MDDFICQLNHVKMIDPIRIGSPIIFGILKCFKLGIDLCSVGSSISDGAEIDAEFETFQYTKDDWATDTYWVDHFNMIQLANEIIHDVDSLKPTDEGSLRNLGEACFFR